MLANETIIENRIIIPEPSIIFPTYVIASIITLKTIKIFRATESSPGLPSLSV